MRNCKYILKIHDIQVLIGITLKYILVYRKCLSEHLAVHLNPIYKDNRSNCEITYRPGIADGAYIKPGLGLSSIMRTFK